MRILNNAACLNGCGLALTQSHGCTDKYRIRIAIVVLLFAIILSPIILAAEGTVDRSSVGQITAYSGVTNITHTSVSIGEGMQIGGKIYPQDVISTGQGSIELVFGINSRIKIGSNTELLIESVTQKSKIKDKQLYSTVNYNLVLKKGVVRARVRENFITSTVLTFIAGDVRVVAPRSDIIVSRELRSSVSSYVGILIAWGRASVNMKNANDADWNPNNEKVVAEGFNSLIEDRDNVDEQIKWEKIGIEQARDAVQELPFSIDKNSDGFENIPERIPELQGA